MGRGGGDSVGFWMSFDYCCICGVWEWWDFDWCLFCDIFWIWFSRGSFDNFFDYVYEDCFVGMFVS